MTFEQKLLIIIISIVLLIIFSFGALYLHEFFVLKEFNMQIGLILFLLINFSIFSYNTLTKFVNYLFLLPSKIKTRLNKS